MPLIANSGLPTYERLRSAGQTVLSPDRAAHQDIRELHIGLLNLMPDSALEATERQFFRLVGESNPIAQLHMHPFAVGEQARGDRALNHIGRFYDTVDRIQDDGLDGLIISGANPAQPELSDEPFWRPLTEIMSWAEENVTSTLCSCLATHAVLQHKLGIRRWLQPVKRWGVYEHRLMSRDHPLVHGVNTRFCVPHSRWYDLRPDQFGAAGSRVLVESEVAGVHMATSGDGFRMVFLQGHPEYDTISLLKEYKREVARYWAGTRGDFPASPENYFRPQTEAIFEEYKERLDNAKSRGEDMPEFPEMLVTEQLDNTWHDTGEAIIANWIGLIYQLTHVDRRRPFMDSVDPNDPLRLAG